LHSDTVAHSCSYYTCLHTLADFAHACRIPQFLHMRAHSCRSYTCLHTLAVLSYACTRRTRSTEPSSIHACCI
jgi:hypothetical protein